jgi:hypothetical protein
MPRIKTYDRLDSQKELGRNAELFLDSTCFDVSNMTVREMMVVYEPEILKADDAFLRSEDAGSWKWNHDRRKWEKVVN